MKLSYHEPDELLEDEEAVLELSEVAVDAFGKEGKTVEDMEESMRGHVLPYDGVLTLEDDGFIGFASMESISTPYGDDLIYGRGAAVRDDYQGEGFGTLLHVAGVLEEANRDDNKVFVGAKTQNPRVLSYMIDVFNAHPRPDSTTPEDVGRMMDLVPEQESSEEDYTRPVVENAYGEPLYDNRPEHELASFMDEIQSFDYTNGDAVVVVGKADVDELQETYKSAVEGIDEELLEPEKT